MNVNIFIQCNPLYLSWALGVINFLSTLLLLSQASVGKQQLTNCQNFYLKRPLLTVTRCTLTFWENYSSLPIPCLIIFQGILMQFWWYWGIGLHGKVFNRTPLRLNACTQNRYLNIIGGTAYSVHCIYDDDIIVVFQFDYFIRDGEQRGHFAAFINCHALFHAYFVLWHDMFWITFWQELCPRQHQIVTLSMVYKKHLIRNIVQNVGK